MVLFRRSEVVELVVIAALGFTALLVIGTLLTVFSVVGWFLWLPFKILGWFFKLAGLLFALPFILLAGLLRDDRRLLHDLLAGLIAVRRGS